MKKINDTTKLNFLEFDFLKKKDKNILGKKIVAITIIKIINNV